MAESCKWRTLIPHMPAEEAAETHFNFFQLPSCWTSYSVPSDIFTIDPGLCNATDLLLGSCMAFLMSSIVFLSKSLAESSQCRSSISHLRRAGYWFASLSKVSAWHCFGA